MDELFIIKTYENGDVLIDNPYGDGDQRMTKEEYEIYLDVKCIQQ